MPRSLEIRIAAAAACVGTLIALAVVGCGAGHEQMSCGPEGCQVCDAYGCRPAEPGVGATGGAGGSGDAATVCDPSKATCACVTNAQCTQSTTCIEGLCLVPCEYSSQCGQGRICANGKCEVGCDALTKCPDGYDCSAKGVCEVSATNPQCNATKPCTGGLTCSGGVCVGGCSTTAQCAAGELCEASFGACIQDPQPNAPCEKAPNACTAQQTCVGGYCRFACTTAPQCSLIDARIPVCDEGVCKSTIEASPECLMKADCASGKDCVSNTCL